MKRQLRISKAFSFIWGLSALALLAGGCAKSKQPAGEWQGPHALSIVAIDDWTTDQIIGKRLSTPHYTIYTTVQDDVWLTRAANALEGALMQYQRLTPEVSLTDRPMECYIFGQRSEWAEFTRRHTGTDAPVYLQIMRGGYCARDRFVAYHIGDITTLSVAAHEGWHQYVARHFKGRLPPFLEEGISCLFEKIEWEEELPRWNLSINPSRAVSLRRAMNGKYLYPLEELIAMHAGQIVNQPGDRIEAFYAQNWAFAKFLWEADDARYRPVLEKLLSDAAAGTIRDPSRSHLRAGLPWNPQSVKPLLESYLEMSFEEIESAYLQYLQTIAFDDFKGQWST